MATVTSRRAEPSPKIVAEYFALCAERVDIKIARAGDDAREEQIDARLKQIATDLGDSFTVAIPDKGEVKFSGAVAAECKGEQPILQTEFWLAIVRRRRPFGANGFSGGEINLDPISTQLHRTGRNMTVRRREVGPQNP